MRLAHSLTSETFFTLVIFILFLRQGLKSLNNLFYAIILILGILDLWSIALFYHLKLFYFRNSYGDLDNLRNYLFLFIDLVSHILQH